MDILKLRTFALRKKLLRKLKGKLQKSVSYIFDKGLLSKIHKELSILKSKKKALTGKTLERKSHQREKLKHKQVKICSTSHSVQLRSVTQSCPTLCDPMNCSTPGLPVHHQLLEFTQTHIHRVGDAIQPSHPLLSPSPPVPSPSQHQSFPMSQLFA